MSTWWRSVTKSPHREEPRQRSNIICKKPASGLQSHEPSEGLTSVRWNRAGKDRYILVTDKNWMVQADGKRTVRFFMRGG